MKNIKEAKIKYLKQSIKDLDFLLKESSGVVIDQEYKDLKKEQESKIKHLSGEM